MGWAELLEMSWRSQEADSISTWSKKGDWGKEHGSRAQKIPAGCGFSGRTKTDFNHLCLSSCCRKGILPGYRGWQPRLLRKSCQPALVQHVPVVRMDFWHVWDSASAESTGGVSPGQGQWPDPYLLSVGINIYKYGFSAQRARLSLSLTWLFGALGKRPS